MMTNEWKVRLRPVGILLIGYFVGPPIIAGIMGTHDVLFGGFSVSNIIQAGLGGYILHKLFGLKEALNRELTAKLDRFGQPHEKVLELSGEIFSAAGFVSMIVLMLPPVGGMFPDSRLMTLAKLGIVGYIVYLACGIWKLYEPFMAYVPTAEEPPPAPEPPAPPVRRCGKCGQKVDDSMKFCAFCGKPIQL